MFGSLQESPWILALCIWHVRLFMILLSLKSLWACFVWQHVNLKCISVSDEWKCWLWVFRGLYVCTVSVGWQLFVSCSTWTHTVKSSWMPSFSFFFCQFSPITVCCVCCFCYVAMEGHYVMDSSSQNKHRYILMLKWSALIASDNLNMTIKCALVN